MSPSGPDAEGLDPAQEPVPQDLPENDPLPSEDQNPSLFHEEHERYEAITFEEDASSHLEDDLDASSPEDRGKAPSVIVRYGQMRMVGQFRHNLDHPLKPGTKVVIRTERGVELGEVLSRVEADKEKECYGCLSNQHLDDFLKKNGEEYPFRRNGKILRLANNQDIIDQRHLDNSAHEETTFCRNQIRELNIDMRLVAVEHLLGGERIIFFFAAENRVDFRELVRRLAAQYRTRIEMRQVGARDEARLVADYERCGQRCCCQQFIKDLRPISMRMAKTQKATLDPSKISGRCGRLMCCLRFEDECYEVLRKKLPKKGIWVRTADLAGKVVDGQILTQLVRIQLPDMTFAAIPNEDILQKDIDPEEALQFARQARQSKTLTQPQPKVEPPEPEATEPPPTEEEESTEPARRKRRRRRKPNPANSSDAESSSPPLEKPDTPGGDTASSPQKRRRRRRRKKPGGNNNS